MRIAAALAWAAVAVAGCSIEPLVLEGRECPCLAGWVCDEAANTCVPDGPGDARVDSRPVDGGVDAILDTTPADTMAPDSGLTDAESDTATADTGPAPTGCEDVYSDRLFCDGFEDEGFAAWDGERTPGASTVERVTDVVYRGTGALKATAAADQNFASVHAEVFSVPEPENQYLRAYYYIPSGYPPGIELNEMASTARDANFVVYTRNATEHDFHTHGWSGGRQTLATLLPTDTWFCLEARIEFGDPGSITVYLDDVLVSTQTGLANTPPAGLSLVVAGIAWNNDGAERVLYVDEVVADTSRIGCD